MKATTLSRDDLVKLLDYDPISGIFVWRVDRRGGNKAGAEAGYIQDKGYRYIAIGGRSYRANRLAWLYMRGAWPDHQVDHRNGNRDDNAWENLRAASSANNNWNRTVASNSTTGVKGVYLQNGRYYCTVEMKGHRHRIGHFPDLELAEMVVQEFRTKLHGEFARHG